MHWRWLLLQVVLPILGPVAASSLFVFLWWTGNDQFVIKPGVIFDLTPWALTFFALTLTGSTLYEFWPRIPGHIGLGFGLVATAVATSVYAAYIVIWRHDEKFAAGPAVYIASVVLFVVTILLCHRSHSATKASQNG